MAAPWGSARKTTSESEAMSVQLVPFSVWVAKPRRFGKTSATGRPCSRKAVKWASSTRGCRESQRTSSPPAYPDAPATLTRSRSICIFIHTDELICKRLDRVLSGSFGLDRGDARGGGGEPSFLLREGVAERGEVFLGRVRQSREGRFGQRLQVGERGKARVAQEAEQLARPEPVEPPMEPAKPRPLVARLANRVPDGRERVHLAEGVLEEVGPEEGVAERQGAERGGNVLAAPRDRAEQPQPRGQVRERQRMVERERLRRAAFSDDGRERLAGRDGHAGRDPAVETDGLAREPLDPTELRERVQNRHVLDRVRPGEAADGGVGGGGHGEAGAHVLVGIGRARPRESERVVSERDLVEPAGAGELLVVGKEVAEEVERRRRLGRVNGRDLREVVAGQADVGVRRVDPGGADATARLQREDEITADLAGEADALPGRQVGPRSRPVDDEKRPPRMAGNVDVGSGPDFRLGPERRELFSRRRVRAVNGGGGVAASVQDDDDEHVAPGARRDRRERGEKGLVLSVGGYLERVPERSFESFRHGGLGFGPLRQVFGDGVAHGIADYSERKRRAFSGLSPR